MDHEPRMFLKTIRGGGRAGLSSGLIRRGSRASAEDRTRPQPQVTDQADLPRTHGAGGGAGPGRASEYRVDPGLPAPG